MVQNQLSNRLEIAESFNLADWLISQHSMRPDRVAFVDDHGSISYRELETAVRSMGTHLRATGLRPEERVLILMHDCIDWPICFLGAIYAGLVPVAVNTLLSADDYAYMLKHCRARAAFVSKALDTTLKNALEIAGIRTIPVFTSGSIELERFKIHDGSAIRAADTHKDEPAFWLYSSGSTGRPKGTVHSHANAFYTAHLYGKPILGIVEADICFSAAKLFFAYGLGNALTFPLSQGATTILMAERPTPDAVFKRWVGGVGGIKPTVFFGAPTGFAGMLASPNFPAKERVALRLASSAGEALPAEIGQKFTERLGIEIVDGIGSTEMLHIFLSNQPGNVQYGTTGYPVPGYEIELRGDFGAPVPDGEPGDLYIKGPSAALMYFANNAKTRETFQGEWTKSGDKYVRNPNGTFTYSGRSDDMLKVSGIYVSPFEVEATLIQHSSVLEAAVIGIEDEQGLTKTKAFVVLKSNQELSADELKAFVKDRLAPYKYPRQIEFVKELPKTATGKIQRFKLRDLENSRVT
jgi:benzoate-CoA ligase